MRRAGRDRHLPAGALRLYQATGQASYLQWAQTIDAWDNAHLEAGPSGNGLYYDTLTGSTLTDSIQFTYDTGVLLEADVLWYRVTGNRQYLVTAERLATAASAAFVDPADGVMAQAGASGPAFDSIYLQAAADLAAADGNRQWRRIGAASASAAARWDQDQTSAGTTYGANWEGPTPTTTGEPRRADPGGDRGAVRDPGGRAASVTARGGRDSMPSTVAPVRFAIKLDFCNGPWLRLPSRLNKRDGLRQQTAGNGHRVPAAGHSGRVDGGRDGCPLPSGPDTASGRGGESLPGPLIVAVTLSQV